MQDYYSDATYIIFNVMDFFIFHYAELISYRRIATPAHKMSST